MAESSVFSLVLYFSRSHCRSHPDNSLAPHTHTLTHTLTHMSHAFAAFARQRPAHQTSGARRPDRDTRGPAGHTALVRMVVGFFVSVFGFCFCMQSCINIMYNHFYLKYFCTHEHRVITHSPLTSLSFFLSLSLSLSIYIYIYISLSLSRFLFSSLLPFTRE